jgi:hypothetical protein
MVLAMNLLGSKQKIGQREIVDRPDVGNGEFWHGQFLVDFS